MSDTIADAVPDEFWAVIADARQDPERFRGILKSMTREQIIDFYWTYEELANHLRTDRLWPHVDPDLSEDGLAELANWVVAQGKAYFTRTLDDPDLIPKRKIDAGLLSEAVEEFEERFDDDVPINTHEWDAEWKQHGKNSPWTPGGATGVTDERIVLSPELTYDELNDALAERSWVWTSGPSTPPLVPGEPELATWRHDTAGSLVYTCNPVVWLRLLDLGAVTDPAERIALALGLPQLESEDIGRFLRSGDVERTLLGVLAAEVLDGTEHLPAIRALMHHREPSVARAAASVCVRLT